ATRWARPRYARSSRACSARNGSDPSSTSGFIRVRCAKRRNSLTDAAGLCIRGLAGAHARGIPQDLAANRESSQSMALTLTPGTLIVASAYPDPPFDLIENGSASGFDIELMRAICAQLGLALQPVRYSGADFNGIFDGLAKGSYDVVISGT